MHLQKMETRRDNHKTEMGNGKTSIQKLAPKIQLNNQIQLKLDNDGM